MYYVATPEFIARLERGEKRRADLPHGKSHRRPAAISTASTPCSPRWTKPAWRKSSSPKPRCGRTATSGCTWTPSSKKWRSTPRRYPDRFVGLAGYNPFRIKESLAEIERAVKEYGFKGVYVHIYGFDIPLHDAKMYPLYAKCDELKIPVSHASRPCAGSDAERACPADLSRSHRQRFSRLKIIGAHTGWPWVEELISVCYKWDNVYFGVDAWMPKYLKPEIIHYINSRMGQDRCLWGTNGLPWKESLDQWDEMGLKEAPRENCCTITPPSCSD